jgi:hypothetical protein
MKLKNPLLMLVVFVSLAFATSSCIKDEPEVPAARTSYNLETKDVLGVTGTVTFIETSSTSATIEVQLKGTPDGALISELCMNSAIEGGEAVVTLNPIDETGKSSTTISEYTYQELIEYDGFVQVYQSSLFRKTIVAIGDIGGNVLTDTQILYSLKQVENFGVTGTARFQKRMNGNTLVTISLAGTIEGKSYPATINIGSVATVGGGDTKKTLNPIDGSTGKSYTNVRQLDNNVKIEYENWLVYVGYINIYQNSPDYFNIICQGDIGANIPK